MNIQNTNTNKKSTRVIYEGWLDYILSCEKELGKDYAAKLTKALLCAIFEREYLTDSAMINAYIEGTVLPLSLATQERYQSSVKNGSKGGTPPLLSEDDNQVIAKMRSEKITQKQIANHFGVSVETIRRSKGWKNWEDYADRAKPGRTGPGGQNLYVYDYVYDYDYDYNYKNDYAYDISNGKIVSVKTGEVLADVSSANYDRDDYWSNVTNPILEIQEDPSILSVLRQYPNYLTYPMLGLDSSYPDKPDWLYGANENLEKTREQQHFDAATAGYRLSKLDKKSNL